MKKSFFVFVLAFLCLFVNGQQDNSVTKANYQLAAKYSPARINKMVFSTSVEPHWLKNTNRFWYSYKTTEGTNWYIVDPNKAEKKKLFDNDKMAAMITSIVGDPFDGQHLSFDSLQFIGDETKIRFQVKSSIDVVIKDTAAKKKDAAPKKEKKTFYFEYNINSGKLDTLSDFKRPLRKSMWANVAPDSSIVIYGKNYNLYWMDFENYKKAQINDKDTTIIEHAITTDGVQFYSWHFRTPGETNVDAEKNKKDRKPVFAVWSPDSKSFALKRTDERKVKDLWVINSIAEPRPTLETYKYWMPGETDAPRDEIYLFRMADKKPILIKTSRFKDQTLDVFRSTPLKKSLDDDFMPSLWLGNNSSFFLSRTSRDLKRIDICKVNVSSDTALAVIEERLNTYIEIIPPGLVNGGKEIIEWSERDGWGHFYLYDGDGKLKNQITSGPYHCSSIMGIDEKKRVLYFSANGRENVATDKKGEKQEKEDPYYLHLYKVNFDGSGLQLLNAGNYDNQFLMDDNQQYFVNNFSRVNTVPESNLINNEGKVVMKLETSDFSALMESGYKFPEIFKVKADDGITDLYGVMYKPFDFDASKKYPVIEYVYPGPQTESVNKAWGRGMDRIDRLAQLGFIVVTVGNRGGTPERSKWYHNYGYGDLRDYGLADKKTAIEQLANRYSFMDVNRVGIHGHSGGGFMSTAAMLVYPDFFKVAVSNAGNHDNSIYNRWWSEKHNGVKEEISDKGDTTFVYSIERNQDLAKNLKGRLLLIHGEIDNNVSPSNSIRVANGLIRANKRFEMLLLPTQRHAFGDMMEYWFWKTADHFSKYLLGDNTERPVDLYEMNRDTDMSGPGKKN
ncbi:MAG: DPP IV N-terminal domain-containing protein [Bacteroidetes bacterium]|nr:DPP IV N-terminal domain-containing protein [Bacteroidota bacterium]